MTTILQKLILYWEYPFVHYALIAGVLIAFCSSLLGVTLVLKRFSFHWGWTFSCGVRGDGDCCCAANQQ